jgi:hypothetical protein
VVTQARLFGLAEANQLVPLLQRTFEAAVPVVARLRIVLDKLELRASDTELLDERTVLTRHVERLLGPLEELGIEVKSADGLVDFRATRDGRLVNLCWKFPETEIGFWHDLESGFAGRQRIKTPDEFEASLLC